MQNGPQQHGQGFFAANVVNFARALRVAGLSVGPNRVREALAAIALTGFGAKEDLYWTLHAHFVTRHEDHEIFDQAFHIFWRDPQIMEKVMAAMLETVDSGLREPEKKPSNRIAAAFAPPQKKAPEQNEEQQEIEVEGTFTFSDRETLQSRDFETMTPAELAAAKQAIAAMRIAIMEVPLRRMKPDARGHRLDMRATLRATMRSGGDTIMLRRKGPVRRHPPIVVLCDISGSMSRYSRMFLHFLHAITNDQDRVHSFLFGTRLTNITRHLQNRDVDVAVDAVTAAVEDWSGGTRIGETLREFNRVWARRVLGQNPVVLFISDGLDREAGEGIGAEMERLHKSCRRLIWLNPLLRYDAFEPKSAGIRAILPHVDEFRPIHNLDSLQALTDALARPLPKHADGLPLAMMRKIR